MNQGLVLVAIICGLMAACFFLASLAAHFAARSRRQEVAVARSVDAIRLVRSVALQQDPESGPGAAAQLAAIRRSAIGVLSDLVDTGGNE